jgi:hypothetical protein
MEAIDYCLVFWDLRDVDLYNGWCSKWCHPSRLPLFHVNTPRLAQFMRTSCNKDKGGKISESVVCWGYLWYTSLAATAVHWKNSGCR